ncbi:MAG: hypothetical protein AMXMBFR36_39010 [Acidobacteriota bacterium]
MCAVFKIDLRGFHEWDSDLVQELRAAGGLEPHVESRDEQRGLLRLSLAPWGEGCGCGLVENPNEGWKKDPWVLSTPSIRNMTRSIEVLAPHAREGLILQLDWLGPDRPDVDEERVQLGDLLRRVATNNLKAGRRYGTAA